MAREVRKIGRIVLIASGLIGMASGAVGESIWGRQGGNMPLQTQKVDLSAPKTITSVFYQNTDNYCIWSGVPRASMLVCGRDQDLVGTVLPAGKGYFLIPALSPTNNGEVYADVRVK